MLASDAINYLHAINAPPDMAAFPKTQQALYLGAEALALLIQLDKDNAVPMVYYNQHPQLENAVTGGLKRPRQRQPTKSQ